MVAGDIKGIIQFFRLFLLIQGMSIMFTPKDPLILSNGMA
jgi:hypothetical protein